MTTNGISAPEQPKNGLLRRFSSLKLGNKRTKDPQTPLSDGSSYKSDSSRHSSRLSSPKFDKNWAQAYINDPLTAPQPSQECGPGSTFMRQEPRKDKGKGIATNGYPTPPTSAKTSPRNDFHPSNPFSNSSARSSPESRARIRDEQKLSKYFESDEGQIRRKASTATTKSQQSERSPVLSGRPASHRHSKPSIGHPVVASTTSAEPARSQTVRSDRRPPSTRHPSGLGIDRSQSVSSGEPPVRRTQSVNFDKTGIRRTPSLSQRYPGDMSHRPLEQIRKETRAAHKAPHLRRKNMAMTDTIDGLDDAAFGGAYHHEGPYDATLAPRNKNKLYSPVEAVKDSNMEALKATPPEYIKDSLTKHVPLQGTATVPPGESDMSGRRMSYEEGADLMRESDAEGGAYKRYDFIPYHPNDLKGKGEPSYTIERDLKEQKRHRRSLGSKNKDDGQTYEMLPTASSRKGQGATVRQRSYSSSINMAGPSSAAVPRSADNDIRRSNTTGKKLSEGLKRRIGSLRRKVDV